MKSVTLRFEDVEIEARVEDENEDISVEFYNQNSGEWSEYPDQTFQGWSFQEDKLNEQMQKLIKFVKNTDSQWFADADEGDVIVYDEKGNPNFQEKVNYEIYEAVGGHKVRGTKVNGKWIRLTQYQLINGHWTDAGCNWFKDDGDMIEFLEDEGKLVESGTAQKVDAEEYTGDEELKGKVLLIAQDEFGNDVFI